MDSNAQATKIISARIPVKVDQEIGAAAEKLGMSKGKLYRNLLYMALEDYRLLNRMGLMRAAAYVTGAKQRMRDELELIGKDDLLDGEGD